MNKKPDPEDTVTGKTFSFEEFPDIVGQQIGDYKIAKEIGRGGMAIVYEAYQISLKRPVALKIIPKNLVEEPEYLERFKREATGAANLNHPNIVSIYGFGQYKNTYYYVMELVHGKPLDEIIERKKHDLLKSAKHFGIKEALDIIEQVANALAYAHKQGIIHRDIKPNNIFIDDETGGVLVTDFGLAKSKRWEKITPRASLFGTPAYMSPEQAQGKELDHRTDIYSLGAALYEMLTGSTPFPGDNALEVIDKVKSDPITPPSKIRSDIPLPVESIIIKAMSKDIWLRYQSVEEFLKSIKKFQSGEKITTFMQIATHQIPTRKRRNLFIILYILICTAVIIGATVAWNYIQTYMRTEWLTEQIELAQNYERMGIKYRAHEIYREIIKKYPQSEYADLARKKLEGF